MPGRLDGPMIVLTTLRPYNPLTFGLVSIPVELRTAVRADHVSFRMLHAEDLSPVKYERVCQADGEPVPWGEIVKGYEYEKGKFVVLEPAELKALALPSSKAIEVLEFVAIRQGVVAHVPRTGVSARRCGTRCRPR